MSIFRRIFRFPMKVRLRHIFRIGILLEEQGEAFYRSLSRRLSNPESEKLCLTLADDEARHRQLLEQALRRWIQIPISETEYKVLERNLQSKDIFSNPPSANASLQEVIQYAIEQENKSVEFYQSFEKSFDSDTWKLMHLQDLVREERAHADKLSSILV